MSLRNVCVCHSKIAYCWSDMPQLDIYSLDRLLKSSQKTPKILKSQKKTPKILWKTPKFFRSVWIKLLKTPKFLYKSTVLTLLIWLFIGNNRNCNSRRQHCDWFSLVKTTTIIGSNEWVQSLVRNYQTVNYRCLIGLNKIFDVWLV